MTWLDFRKSQFQFTKFIIWKRKNCRKTQMLWHGRPNGCGLRLPEYKKATMWHRRERCCGLWTPAFPRSVCVCVGSRLWVLMNARFDNIRIEEDSSIFIIVPYSQYIQYILYIYIYTYWNISRKYWYLSLSLISLSCKLSFMSFLFFISSVYLISVIVQQLTKTLPR